MPKKWTPCRLSHLFHLFLYCLPTLLHYINKVGIHEVDEKINAKNDDNSREKDSHEFVLIKGQPPPKYKELRGELVLTKRLQSYDFRFTFIHLNSYNVEVWM